MLATLFLSQGTPMLLAGDEFANSQDGNNNAYCQDNDIGWLDWEGAYTDLQSFVAHLSAFRQDHICLRQSRFLHGGLRPKDGNPDVSWTDFDGEALEWRDPGLAKLCLTLRCSADAPDYEEGDDVVFIVFNRNIEDGRVVLPALQKRHHWARAIDTHRYQQASPKTRENENALVSGQSVVAFVQNSDGQGA